MPRKEGKVTKYGITLDFCPLMNPPKWLNLTCQAADLWPILDKDKTSADLVILAAFLRDLRK